jgi:hypothetical protein
MTIGRRGGNASLRGGAPQGLYFVRVDKETDALRFASGGGQISGADRLGLSRSRQSAAIGC